MSGKPVRTPGPDHPITIDRNPNQVTVTLGGRTLALSSDALILRESSYPPVHYIPRKDVEMSRLQRTTHTTYCPYKGECSYYSIPEGGVRAANAVWSYESPYPAVAAIAGHLAFYPDRVDSITESAPEAAAP